MSRSRLSGGSCPTALSATVALGCSARQPTLFFVSVGAVKSGSLPGTIFEVEAYGMDAFQFALALSGRMVGFSKTCLCV